MSGIRGLSTQNTISTSCPASWCWCSGWSTPPKMLLISPWAPNSWSNLKYPRFARAFGAIEIWAEVYQVRPLIWNLRCAHWGGVGSTRANFPRCASDAEGKTFNTYFSFLNARILILFLLCVLFNLKLSFYQACLCHYLKNCCESSVLSIILTG